LLDRIDLHIHLKHVQTQVDFDVVTAAGEV